MKKVCEENQCAGCGACNNVCPMHCIEMVTNQAGILISKIDEEKCIDCGKCKNVCPIITPVELNIPLQVWAACAENSKIRERAASGGVASVFYQKMIQNGGVTYGVVMNERLWAVFKRAENLNEIKDFSGSKYVGSVMEDIYIQVADDLDKNRKVLFIAMSCQIAGLLNFLGHKRDNLITVDILCHGMPSHLYFAEYIEDYEKKLNEKVKEVSFRDSNIFRLRCQFTNSIYECRAKYDKYYAGYTSMLFYRDNCYSCLYARPERVADITLGDFWGYKGEIQLEPTEQGVSMVLVNTEKGKEFFEMCKEKMKIVPSTIERAVRTNLQLQMPSPIHPLRKDFIEIYEKFDFNMASRKIIEKIIRRNKFDDLIKNLEKNFCFPIRSARFLKRKIKQIFNKKYIGKFIRNKWRNTYERKQLINTDFTILSNTCIGGIISHDMGLQFLSPTVNLYIRPAEFVRFVANLEYYLSLELVEINHTAPYPVAKLGDLTLYLKHYESFDVAKAKWEERKRRINFEKIYLMMTDRDFEPPQKERRACSVEVLKEFNQLPYKKVCFTGECYADIECSRVVDKNKENNCVGIITDIVDFSGKRLYQYAENFDYIDWLNE